MYGKIENDNVVFYNEKYIIVEKEVEITDEETGEVTETIQGQFRVFNPTEEQMREQGWYPVEYIDEVGEHKVEDNKLKLYIGREYIRTVEEAKRDMQIRIDSYDTSSAVNGFYYGEQELWIDKATRVGLVNAANAATALGNETMTFGIQGISVTLPCEQALQMLYALEMYALACYNVTLNHKNAVDALDNVEDIDAYDYMAGYPDKLRFEV